MRLEPLNDLPLIEEAGAMAAARGMEIYAVGGCVRDWALGRPSADLDFLLSGEAAPLAGELAAKYGGSFTRFDKFLTARAFLGDGRRVDLARFRVETYSAPAALPQALPAESAERDLGRRDFSANALAVAVMPGRLGEMVDPFGGLSDIQSGTVRALHPGSFTDDPTRIFRAARFAGRFGWRLEKETKGWIRECVKRGIPAMLSRERLRNELIKLLEETEPGPAFALLKSLNALKFLHGDFVWPGSASSERGYTARLAAIAAAMGRSGAAFLESLKLSNKTVAGIKSSAAGRFGKHL